MNEIEELQNTLILLYQKNITFLKKHYQKLYQRIETFESLNQESKFINFENGYFELTDDKGNTTYNCNPFFDAQQRAKKIESSQAIFSMTVEKIESANYYEKDEISAHLCVEEFLKYKQNHTIPNSKKFIFIGTLLGIHINDIHRAINQKSYLILEPSLETFRLSLFLTDYEELSQSAQLFFSIEENNDALKNTLYQFLEYEFSDNHAIKFELASEKELYLIETLKNLITGYNPFIHSFSEELIDLKRGNNLLKESTHGLLDYKNLMLFNTETPVLILGAGPSLEKEATFIKKYHSKFFLVVAAATLKRLEVIDVVPNMIVSLDKKEEIYNQFDVDEKYYKDAIILLSTKTHKKLFNKLQPYSTFLIQTAFEVFKNKGTSDAVSVGDFICKFALQCRAKKLYLLGIDAAFDNHNLHTHDSLHESNQVISEEKLFEVKGNFEKSVLSNTTFAEIISSFDNLPIETNTKVYNLSSTGALLPNTQPLKSSQLTLEELCDIDPTIQTTLLKAIQENSSKELGKQTKENYAQEYQLLEKLNIQDKLFDSSLIALYENNLSSLSLTILYHYLKLINPYLYANYSDATLKIKNSQLKVIYEQLSNLFSPTNY